jgi:hypothetical protein
MIYRNRILTLVVAAALLCAALTAVVLSRASTNASASSISSTGKLEGVNQEDLAKAGIQLGPINGTPSITKEQAAEIASQSFSDPIADETYADCTQLGSDGEVIQHAPCWAVAFTPPSDPETGALWGPDGDYNDSHAVQTTTEVALVNADTGEVMIGFKYGNVVDTGDQHTDG